MQHRMRTSPTPLEVNSELEAARPQTAGTTSEIIFLYDFHAFYILGEEELQLQLALAMSREEAEQDENKSKSDDMRLQLALQKSKEESGSDQLEADGFTSAAGLASGIHSNSKPSSDLLDLDFGNPIAQPPPPQRTAASSSVDPWGAPMRQQTQQPPQNDPWGESTASAVAPSAAASAAAAAVNDPWSPVKEPPRTSPLPNLGGHSTMNQPNNDPWSPIPAAGQDKVLKNDAWGSAPETVSANNDLSIDPFSPMAQKELNEFDLLRNEIESSKSNNGGTKILKQNQVKVKLLFYCCRHHFTKSIRFGRYELRFDNWIISGFGKQQQHRRQA